MARESIKVAELAEEMGTNRRSIARLRAGGMPYMDGEKLGFLLFCLNKLKKRKKTLLNFDDLMTYSLTPEEVEAINNAQESLKE